MNETHIIRNQRVVIRGLANELALSVGETSLANEHQAIAEDRLLIARNNVAALEKIIDALRRNIATKGAGISSIERAKR